jgi:hypothetical protein
LGQLLPLASVTMPLLGFFFFTHKLTEVWAIAAFAVNFFAYPLSSVNGAPDSAREAPGCPG